MKLRLDLRYAVLTLAYLGVIYGLSSVPGLSTPGRGAAARLVSNLSHAPVFAGLALCVLRSLSGERNAAPARYGLAFAVSVACAALDEWHQSFVPGRQVSAGDFLVDVLGIGGVLLFVHLHARRKERTSPTAPAECCTHA